MRDEVATEATQVTPGATLTLFAPTMRAKFTVVAITDRGGTMKTIELQPRYDTTIPEDQRLASATPWGEMRLGVDNPAAVEQFKIGEDIYVDFTPAG